MIAASCARHFLVGLLTCAATLNAQLRPETIHGVVRTSTGAPAAGADVILTRAPDRAVFRTSSDRSGRYSITVDSGTGDYLLHVSLKDRADVPPYRKRLLRAAPADTVIVADVQLRAPAGATQGLGAVRVSAQRPRPVRGEEGGASLTGGVEHENSAPYAALAPSQRGDLEAIAATMPGFTRSADGVTAFGISSAQNSVTLNGLAFPGATIPRDIRTNVRVGTATYDPARGWFGGAETRLDVGAGRIFADRSVSVTYDAPALQGRSLGPAGAALPFANVSTSLAGSGSFAADRLTYNYGVQASDRRADVSTLNALDADALRHAGLAADSATRLLQVLRAAHVPVGIEGRSTPSFSRNGTVLLRINTPEVDPRTMKTRPTSKGLILYGWRQEGESPNLTTLTLPSTKAQTTNGIASLQGVLSTFVNENYLQELRSAISLSANDVHSASPLPAGRVFVGSDLRDDRAGFAAVDFGGLRGRLVADRAVTWESQSETRFYLSNHLAHRLRVNADLRFDQLTRTTESNANGTYVYNSLADLAGGRPATFSRSLAAPQRTFASWNFFASAGDFFRASPSLSLLYGGRLEGEWRLPLPIEASTAAAAFSQTGVPARHALHLSPRLGFSWNYSRKRKPPSGNATNAIGQFSIPSSGVLRGGIGEFRALLGPRLLADLLTRAEQLGGVSRLACVGDAVPLPQWDIYASSPQAIPTSCATSGAETSRADAAPSVVMFSRNFTAPRSWRANLSWTTALPWAVVALDGVFSLNLRQPATTDLNFAGEPRFVASGDGRPVFASLQGIDAATGAVSAVESRRDGRFGRVTQLRSDGQSRAAQAVLSLTPNFLKFRGVVWGSLSYTLSSVRERTSGYDGTTFGSPAERYWSRSALDVRHAVIAQFGKAFRSVNVGLVARLSSGRPFTPIVNADVNGDGLINDRAVVPSPAIGDASVASAMRALLRVVPGAVRPCLERQMGRVAGPSSCTGPWSAELNTRIGIANPAWRGALSRLNVAVNVTNPLAGLDQALHGPRNLRGWGGSALPDPVLLRVDGFDASQQRFRYAVNPHFGSSQSAPWALRAPFGVALEAKVDIGSPATRQQLDRWLAPGRGGHKGPRLSRNDLLRRYSRNVPDPYARIIAESDSLLLYPEQIDALRKAQAAYKVRTDSLWGALADYLAALPDAYVAQDAFARTERVTDHAWEMGRLDVQRSLPGVLNSLQLQLLPFPAGTMYRATQPIKLRFFVLGDP